MNFKFHRFDPWFRRFGGEGFTPPQHFPFEVKLKTVTGTLGFTVRYGQITLSGTPKTPKLDGTTLVAATASNWKTVGALTAGVFYLKVNVDDTNPYNMEFGASDPEIFVAASLPANTLTNRYITLATWGPPLVQNIFFDIQAARAGDFNETNNLRIWS